MYHTQPTKELVRKWINRRQENPEPLPDIKQIRREVGWTIADWDEQDDRDMNAAV
jgi:hypothetical protein